MRGRLAALAALSLAACTVIGGIETAAPECAVDGAKNGREVDVDCGGPCTKCADGKRCHAHEDCASNACFEGLCYPPDCDDGQKNGLETDVDCGGEDCERCTGGDACLVDEDCSSYTRAKGSSIAACENGFCIAACCHGDCEEGCGCPDPEAPTPQCCPMSCGPALWGSPCPDEPDLCEDFLDCFEEGGLDVCL